MANEEKKTQGPAKQAKSAVKKADTKKIGFFKRVAKWFREMKSELKKVIWPTPKQTLNNTIVALVVMLVAAIVIWGFDSLAQTAVRALISIAG
ncbi:MAG: preprotein translocase subunit SecE [Oscillospiraceae bacterium]|jgi:preprotein translocase subunit SecE